MIGQFKKVLGLAGLLFLGVVPVAEAACPDLLKHEFTGLNDGKPLPLCQFQGKVLLVVNTASYCGFTNQYDGLEKLHDRLKDKGLVVLGFPSNDFGEQEPGSDKQIADFCRLTYGVEFPMVSKTVVKGDKANAFYKELAKRSGSKPAWNFHKYLISRDGQQVVAFSSTTSPEDKSLLARIDEFLNK
ncbi:MAG: glutathione peroxidase [Dechloromonas sp.]|nr:MAG: glutathione peroxidase [Dechloromonas sp.]